MLATRTTYTIFQTIKKKYQDAGYTMPTIIFWNVNSHESNVPVKYNEKGVGLVSGASANLFNLVAEGDIDPIKMMNNAINKERYESFADKLILHV